MKILLQTRFHPSIGGIETLAAILADRWQREGQKVVVSTDVARSESSEKSFPFSVYHRAGTARILNLARWADITVLMNASLKALCVLAPTGVRPVYVHHGCYYTSRENRRDWKARLKVLLARTGRANIACSYYVSRAIGMQCEVIPNTYDDRLFTTDPADERNRHLIFVGRMVSDKGVDLLLAALARLRPALVPDLTLVGDGPEREILKARCRRLGLQSQVTFTGALDQSSVAKMLRQHQILVVPSLWEEPFGIVALEGAACGCAVLASDGGGLPEAVGPTGLTFRRGDIEDLTEKLALLLTGPQLLQGFRAAAPAHLLKHSPALVAAAYLEVFRRNLRK